jgi:DNA polymerase-3 subunit chi
VTRVDFYAGSSDATRTVFSLAHKAVRAGHRVWILTRDAAHTAAIDARLWADPPESFLPHCPADHPLARRTPVVIGHDAAAVPHEDILINLRDETPPCFSRFERLLEVVGNEPASLQAARERFRFYRDRGYPLQHHDLKNRS